MSIRDGPKPASGGRRGASIRHESEDRFGSLSPEPFDADGSMKPEHAAIYELLREYFERIARKYRHAAAHPWERIEPDPPVVPGLRRSAFSHCNGAESWLSW
jgi:hypothetical protein